MKKFSALCMRREKFLPVLCADNKYYKNPPLLNPGSAPGIEGNLPRLHIIASAQL